MEPGGTKGLKWLVLLWFPVYTLQAWQAVRADFWCLQSFSEISQWEHLILLSVVSPLTGCWGTFSAPSSSKNTSATSFCSDHLDPYQEDILGNFPFKIRPVYLPFSEPTSCPKDRQSDVLQQVEGHGSQHCPLLRCHGQLPSASFWREPLCPWSPNDTAVGSPFTQAVMWTVIPVGMQCYQAFWVVLLVCFTRLKWAGKHPSPFP